MPQLPLDAIAQLRAQRVLFLGLEGPGAHAAAELARCGVGTLRLADPFACQPGDLPLMPAGGPEAVGQPRQAVAQAALAPTGVALESGPAELNRAAVEMLLAGCDLAVCTFERGFAAAHHWANRASLAQNIPVLYAECGETGALLGPLVQPGATACFMCYRMRIVANAPDASAALAQEEALDRQRFPALHRRAIAPALAAQAGQLIALQALNFLLGREKPGLAGALLVIDASRQSSRHALLPMPACPVCGNAPAPPLPALAELGAPADPAPDLLDLTPQLLSPLLGVIHSLQITSPAQPTLASAELANHRFANFLPPGQRMCGGKGLAPAEALRSALGEAAERYSASSWDPRQIRYARAADLPGPALDPRELVLFAPEQYTHLPFAPYTGENVLGWARWRALVGGNEVFVPALATFLYYQPRAPEENLFPGSSNGLAAGPSLRSAVLGAACEVLERDAFTTMWLHRLPCERIDPLNHPDAAVAAFCAEEERRGISTLLFRLPTDHPCHVFLALGLSENPSEPATTVGLGASMHAADAARKALLEAAQVRVSLRHLLQQAAAQARAATLARAPQLVATLEDHALLYARREARSALDFLLTRPLTPYSWPHGPADELAALVAHLRASGNDLLFHNLTPPDMAALGIYTARAIIPGYQPIDFGWGGTRLGGTRLFELPQRLGMASAGLNLFPHPFA